MAEIAHSQRLLRVRLVCRGCKFRPFSHANSPRLSIVCIYAWRFWPIVSAFVFSQRHLSLSASVHNTPVSYDRLTLFTSTLYVLLVPLDHNCCHSSQVLSTFGISEVASFVKKYQPLMSLQTRTLLLLTRPDHFCQPNFTAWFAYLRVLCSVTLWSN